jgi:hypothetical protein
MPGAVLVVDLRPVSRIAGQRELLAIGIPLALGSLSGNVRPAFSPPAGWFIALTNESATCEDF